MKLGTVFTGVGELRAQMPMNFGVVASKLPGGALKVRRFNEEINTPHGDKLFACGQIGAKVLYGDDLAIFVNTEAAGC